MREALGQAITPRPHPGPKLGVQGAQMVVLLKKIDGFVRNACFASVKPPFSNWKITARQKVAKTMGLLVKNEPSVVSRVL